MSDEIFRLLPVLISPVSHYKLPHSENGNGLRQSWKEGLTEVGKEGRREGEGAREECTSTASPLRKTVEERAIQEIPTRNRISANILI